MGRKRIHGLGPNMGLVTEAKRGNERYPPEEMDDLLNHIMEEGPSDVSLHRWALKWDRSFKATQRQWELYLYIDKDTKLVDYHPTPNRTWRGGRPFNITDMTLIQTHRRSKKHRFSPGRVALLLQRPVQEIEAWVKVRP